MHGSSHKGMVLSSVQSFMLPVLIRVNQRVVDGLVVCLLGCKLLYRVDFSLDCLRVY